MLPPGWIIAHGILMSSSGSYTGIDFSGADLSNLTFPGGADLSNSTFNDANLSGTDLSQVTLTGATGTGITSNGSTMLPPGWIIADGILMGPSGSYPNTNFIGADLSNLSFPSGVDLSGSNFTGANLTNVDLSQATLTGATGTGITASGPTMLPPGWIIAAGILMGPSGSFPNTNFTGADLSNLTFPSGVDLSGSNFTGADLLGADLSQATLTGATGSAIFSDGSTKLPSGWITPAHYLIGPGGTYSNVDFSGVDLSGITFPSSTITLVSAGLEAANVSGTDFSQVTLNAPDNSYDVTGTPASVPTQWAITPGMMWDLANGCDANNPSAPCYVCDPTVVGSPCFCDPSDPLGMCYDGPPLTSPPSQPTDVTAVTQGTDAVISWMPPSDSGSSAIVSYTATAQDLTNPGTNGDGTTCSYTVSAPEIDSCSISGLSSGDTYTFTVTASNSDQPGSPSDPSSAFTLASVPDAPTGASAIRGNTSASVAFTTPVSDGGAAVTGYTVTATDTTDAGNGGQHQAGTSSPITMTGLVNGDTYTFTVTATNAAGTSAPSGASNAIIPATVIDGIDVYPGANLSDANLAGADLHNMNLDNINFTGADLTGANLVGATLTLTNLTSADLTGAYLTGQDLQNTTITDDEAGGANFTNAHLSGVNLTSVDLTSVNFKGADLTSATFNHIDDDQSDETSLSLVNFTNADLVGATFGFDHSPAGITGWTFAGANLTGVNLAATDLSGTNMAGANLTNTLLTNSNLTGTTLTDATVAGTSFSGATLVSVISSGLVGTPSALPSSWYLVTGSLITGTVPDAPTSLHSTLTGGSDQISFTAGPDGGLAISNYEYSLDGGTSWIALDPAMTASPVTITGFVPDTSVSVELRADNIAGAGPASEASVAMITPSSVTVSNLPASAVVGGSFIPMVSTPGDGTRSVTSSTPSICSVSNAGLVSDVGVGTCTLVAHVATGATYTSADGSDQSYDVGRATPSTPSISNLPGGGIDGSSFTPTVSTTGDGMTSVTSATTTVCTLSGSDLVTYVGVGTCTLVPHVATGSTFLAADGTAQSITVIPPSPLAFKAVSHTRALSIWWMAPSLTPGSVTGYVVRVTDGSNAVVFSGRAGSGTARTAFIGGLIGHATYHVTVAAMERIGTKKHGFTTVQSAPSAPLTVTVAH